MSDLKILVPFISTGGQVQDCDKNLLVDGKEIHRLIMYANSMKKKKHYIFDETTHSQVMPPLSTNSGVINNYQMDSYTTMPLASFKDSNVNDDTKDKLVEL